MEQDKKNLLEIIDRPAFFVRDEIICYANQLAQNRQIHEGAKITKYLTDHLEEYRAFRDGCLYLTIEIGADITELYTNAHEFGFPSNFENETILGTKMDLYNNLQGRKIGVITSKDSVYKVIKNAVMTGKLVKIQGENLIPTNDNMKFEAI